MDDREFSDRYFTAMAELDMGEVSLGVTITSGHTGKPRASSLGDCARKQLFDLREGVEGAEVLPNPGLWSSWMGHAGESVSRAVLMRMGYTIEQPDVPEDLPFTGHVDGVISGLDLDTPAVWDNKVRAAYGFKLLVTTGPDDPMYYQMQAYMHALRLERTLITLLPHDQSAVRREFKFAKMDEPEMVQRLWIEADPIAQSTLLQRAEAVSAAHALGLMVNREFNPTDRKFPCWWGHGGCPHIQDCIMADFEYSSGGLEVPPVRRMR